MRRDLRIDTLRGVLLVLITINHFGAWLAEDWWGFHATWQPLGYVSAAEGFVVLAGYSFAQVYVRYVNEPDVLWRKARQRALSLYLYHVILTLGLAVVYLWAPAYRTAWMEWLSPYDRHPLTSTSAIVLLVHQPPYLDLLPMYALFLLFSPVVMVGLHRHHWPSIFAASLALWLLGQVMPPLDTITTRVLPAHRTGYFNMCSWQMLYVVGLWLGTSYRQSLWVRPLQSQLLWSLIIVAACVFFLSRHALILPELTTGIDRSTLGWLRLLNVLLLISIFSALFPRIPHPQHPPWLAFLGQHSLQVFACHILLLYALAPVTSQLVAIWGVWGFAPLVTLIICFLQVPAFLHDRYKAWSLGVTPISLHT